MAAMPYTTITLCLTSENKSHSYLIDKAEASGGA